MPRLIRAMVWLVGALAIGFGAAGVVAGGDHPPTDTARPELTARGDRVVRGRISPLNGPLERLRTDVAALSDRGRDALVALTAGDRAAVERALDAGDVIVPRIEAHSATIERALATLPYDARSPKLSADVRGRVAALRELVSDVRPVRATWAQLRLGALPALSVNELIDRHDRSTFAATEEGRQARYAAALDHLAVSIETLEQAESVRDQLADNAEVSVLSDWLTRDRTYDEALIRLYTLLRDSGGRVSDESRRAFEAVQAAQRALPQDRDALIVVMSDIAEGGLNQAVIAIETVRGDIEAAVAALN